MSDVGQGNIPSLRRILPDRWAIWDQRSPTVMFVLAIEVGVVVLAVALLVSTPRSQLFLDGPWQARGLSSSGRPALLVAAVLTSLGILHLEIVRAVERTRRTVCPEYGYNSTGVWTFAAALVLLPAPTVVVVLVLYTYAWIRSWRNH